MILIRQLWDIYKINQEYILSGRYVNALYSQWEAAIAVLIDWLISRMNERRLIFCPLTYWWIDQLSQQLSCKFCLCCLSVDFLRAGFLGWTQRQLWEATDVVFFLCIYKGGLDVNMCRFCVLSESIVDGRKMNYFKGRKWEKRGHFFVFMYLHFSR